MPGSACSPGPRHQFFDPSDVACAALFLAGGLAAGINGEALRIGIGLRATSVPPRLRTAP